MAASDGYAPELPEPLILRIQTFLSPQKAAQTTLLSKSWFRAWSTRPTIDLDESHFPGDDSSHKLTVFANKTFQRYEESNLSIDTFILSLEKKWHRVSGLATKWTYKAMKLGATDFTFRFSQPEISAPLHEAVFGSEKVVRSLCLEKARFDRLNVIRCTGLKSISLSHMKLPRDSLYDIISCCPFIENLSLSYVRTTYQHNDNDNDDDDDDNEDDRHHDHDEQQGVRLLNLTSLILVRVSCQFRNLFLNNLSSKFPNLKDLTLNLKVPRLFFYLLPVISSASLENLNLRVDGRSGIRNDVIEIDVPMIRNFIYEGIVMPKFSFRSKSRDRFESHVSLINHDMLSTTWFYKLSEFLTSIAGSKINLFLHLHTKSSHDYLAGDIECSNVPCEVENLIVDTRGLPTKILYSVLDVLFQICRPKMITQHASLPGKDYSSYWQICDVEELNTRNNDVILCRVLEQGMKEKGSLLPRQFLYGLRDLEEVNAQKLCNGVWIPQPFDSMLGSTSDDQQRRFRLQLKWNQYS